MNNVLLTDFSKRELNAVLKSVSIQILYLEQDELRGDIKFKTDKKYIELQDLRLFKVQLLNAIASVQIQEEISSN